MLNGQARKCLPPTIPDSSRGDKNRLLLDSRAREKKVISTSIKGQRLCQRGFKRRASSNCYPLRFLALVSEGEWKWKHENSEEDLKLLERVLRVRERVRKGLRGWKNRSESKRETRAPVNAYLIETGSELKLKAGKDRREQRSGAFHDHLLSMTSAPARQSKVRQGRGRQRKAGEGFCCILFRLFARLHTTRIKTTSSLSA